VIKIVILIFTAATIIVRILRQEPPAYADLTGIVFVILALVLERTFNGAEEDK
jgi:hypothetical protein